MAFYILAQFSERAPLSPHRDGSKAEQAATQEPTFSEKKAAQDEAALRAAMRHPEGMMNITDYDWDNSYNVMSAQFRIRNDNTFPVKDFQISCALSGPSGTIINHVRATVFDRVAAKSNHRTDKINFGLVSGQVSGARCQITSAEVAGEANP